MTPGRTAFVGLSHLGIVSGVGWASLGSEVVGVDPDGARAAALARGELPLHEPGLPELLATSRPRLTFTHDFSALAGCELVVLSRDVPTDANDASDPSVVMDLLERLMPHLAPGATLAIMSQISPGTMRAIEARLRGARPDWPVSLVYWVETLVFGRALERFLAPERVILGCADPRAPLPRVLEDGLRRFGCPLFPMRYESAELAKTAINLYLCAAVTYANTLSDLCERTGADWSEMVPALKADARIGPSAYIRPGLGIAGGNLERDMVTLRELGAAGGADVAFIQTLLDYNGRRHGWVMRTLERALFSKAPAGARPVIAVWGLAYKKNTDSTKNSFALKVLDALRGRADVVAYDPVVRVPEREGLALAMERDGALAGADALLIVTDWDAFGAVDATTFDRMRRPLVIDAVGVTERAALGGVEHVVMGRGEVRAR